MHMHVYVRYLRLYVFGEDWVCLGERMACIDCHHWVVTPCYPGVSKSSLRFMSSGKLSTFHLTNYCGCLPVSSSSSLLLLLLCAAAAAALAVLLLVRLSEHVRVCCCGGGGEGGGEGGEGEGGAGGVGED